LNKQANVSTKYIKQHTFEERRNNLGLVLYFFNTCFWHAENQIELHVEKIAL